MSLKHPQPRDLRRARRRQRAHDQFIEMLRSNPVDPIQQRRDAAVAMLGAAV